MQEQSEVRLERSAWGQRTAGLSLNMRGLAVPIVDMILLTPEIVKQYNCSECYSSINLISRFHFPLYWI